VVHSLTGTTELDIGTFWSAIGKCAVMSRCFPYPPPGYEKKAKNVARSDYVYLLAKEKHNEKEHKKENRDTEKREGKKEGTKTKEKTNTKKREIEEKGTRTRKRRIGTRVDAGHIMIGSRNRFNQTEWSVTPVVSSKEALMDPVLKLQSLWKELQVLESFLLLCILCLGETMGWTADKLPSLIQSHTEASGSANAVKKERNTANLVPDFIYLGQRGNGGNEQQVDSRVSLQQRSDGPYITTAVEKENCK
ncbi:unnamed protein product, partial [Musa acuminata subsp. burmannicoides]